MPAITSVTSTPVEVQIERRLPGCLERIRITGSVVEIMTCALDGEAVVLGKTKRLTALVRRSVLVVATDEDSGDIVYETCEPITLECYESDVLLPPEEPLM